MDPKDKRLHIDGCQDVTSFEAVAGVEKVTPGMLELTGKVYAETPLIRAIVLERSEHPSYSDELRHSVGLPVYDTNTCCNTFVEGLIDKPRFGINKCQHERETPSYVEYVCRGLMVCVMAGEEIQALA